MAGGDFEQWTLRRQGLLSFGLTLQHQGPEHLAQGHNGASKGGTAMGNLSSEIQRTLSHLDPDDMKKVTGFFYLLEEGDRRATEIWSMANDEEIEPKQVADLIFSYMDFLHEHLMHQSGSPPADMEKAGALALFDKRYGYSGS
jgi:hypothetical protein